MFLFFPKYVLKNMKYLKKITNLQKNQYFTLI